jgi:DNA-binding transcriptional LysR family regulator
VKVAFGAAKLKTRPMHVDLSDLRLFVHVAESGNLTRGAARAFISAPAASARIRALEARLDAQLLYRDNRGVSLTQAGETLLHHARIIMRQVDYLRDDFSGPGRDAKGHVRIFANTTAVTSFMPEVLARFMAERPGVTIDLQERLTQDIVRGILDSTADLGIVSGEVDRTGLEAIRFSTDRLLLAVPKGHELAARTSVRFDETLVFEHIGLHEGSTLLAFLRGLLAKNGYDRALRIKVRSFEAMCRMVEAGVGVGVVPDSAARRHARTMDITLLGIDDAWALRERLVLVRSLDALPKAARALVDELVRAEVGGTAD